MASYGDASVVLDPVTCTAAAALLVACAPSEARLPQRTLLAALLPSTVTVEVQADDDGGTLCIVASRVAALVPGCAVLRVACDRGEVDVRANVGGAPLLAPLGCASHPAAAIAAATRAFPALVGLCRAMGDARVRRCPVLLCIDGADLLSHEASTESAGAVSPLAALLLCAALLRCPSCRWLAIPEAGAGSGCARASDDTAIGVRSACADGDDLTDAMAHLRVDASGSDFSPTPTGLAPRAETTGRRATAAAPTTACTQPFVCGALPPPAIVTLVSCVDARGLRPVCALPRRRVRHRVAEAWVRVPPTTETTVETTAEVTVDVSVDVSAPGVGRTALDYAAIAARVLPLVAQHVLLAAAAAEVRESAGAVSYATSSGGGGAPPRLRADMWLRVPGPAWFGGRPAEAGAAASRGSPVLTTAAVETPVVVAAAPPPGSAAAAPPHDAVVWPSLAGLPDVKARLEQLVVWPVRASAAARGGGGTPAPPHLAALAAAMRRMRVSPATGVLLWGPPGCGKTATATALAAAAGLRLIHVHCGALVSKYVGDSEAAVRAAFAAARALAPSLLLLDDVDAVAGARASGVGEGAWGDGGEAGAGGATSGAGFPPTRTGASASDSEGALSRQPAPPPPPVTLLDRMLSTLLNEMDGVGHLRTEDGGGGGGDGDGDEATGAPSASRDVHAVSCATASPRGVAPASGVAAPYRAAGDASAPPPPPPSSLRSYVLVVGTTSRPAAVDPALLRPGRLEAHVAVEAPDTPVSRLALLRHFAAGVACGADVDLEAVAAALPVGATPPDVRAIVTAAAVAAMQERGRRGDAGGAPPSVVRMEHLMRSVAAR